MRELVKQERRYAITLMVLAFFCLIAVGQMVVFSLHPPPGGDRQTNVFVYEITAWIISVYLAVIILTLIVFLKWPVQGYLYLYALNIILMLWLPVGTILGIYYFRKIAKLFAVVSDETKNQAG